MRVSFMSLAVLMFSASIGCTQTPNDIDESQSDEIAAAPQVSAFVLTVSGIEGEDVASPGRVDVCGGGPCNFAYIGGTRLTITPDGSGAGADCLQFVGWGGACAGQGDTCTVVIQSNISAHSQWGRILGCVPR